GLLGNFLCQTFSEQDIPVVALKRAESNHGFHGAVNETIEWREGDILDPLKLEANLEGVDTIIHCAAMISFDKRDRDIMNKTNVEGTKNLVDAALKKGVKRFIHVSSIAAIGRNKLKSTIDETEKWQSSRLNTNYAVSKHLAELEVWRGQAEGLNAVIVNPSVILGPGDWGKSSTRIFKYVWEENKYYTPGTVNYVDVRDVCTAVLKLYHSTINGERFIINAGKTTYLKLFQAIARQFKKKPPTKEVSPLMMRIASFFEYIKSLITNQKPLITRETSRVGSLNLAYDNSKASSELGLEFRELEDTVAWACQLISEKNGFSNH
ncbi:MAG: NAD-dependent epimerase/dehydratase family protein, partial [Bacteroidota bacterium]